MEKLENNNAYNDNIYIDDKASMDPYNYSAPSIFIKRSSILQNLDKVDTRRVYADLSIRDNVETECKEFWEKRGQGR